MINAVKDLSPGSRSKIIDEVITGLPLFLKKVLPDFSRFLIFLPDFLKFPKKQTMVENDECRVKRIKISSS